MEPLQPSEYININYHGDEGQTNISKTILTDHVSAKDFALAFKQFLEVFGFDTVKVIVKLGDHEHASDD